MEIGQSSKTHKAARGRNKTQLKLFEREEHRLITFSKRKSGINKKATELSIMCNAQIALILFSPKGNAFAFGHPELNSVVNKFLKKEKYSINERIESCKRRRNEELVECYKMLECELNQLVKWKEVLKRMAAVRGDRKGWWEVEKVEDIMMKSCCYEVETLFKNVVSFQERLCYHMEMLKLIHQANSTHDGAPVIGIGGGGVAESEMENGGTKYELSDCHLF